MGDVCTSVGAFSAVGEAVAGSGFIGSDVGVATAAADASVEALELATGWVGTTGWPQLPQYAAPVSSGFPHFVQFIL